MKKYGILAYPAKHSLSPAIHNAAFKDLSIDAQYGVFEIPEDGLDEFVEYARHEPVSGLSVSLPHKESIMKYLDVTDDDALKIGAVNTVLNKGGFLYGYNTDFLGSNRALEEIVPELYGRKCVVLGAGGAARAVCYGLLKEGAEVVIQNRTFENAERIVSDFSEYFGDKISAAEWEESVSGDILINATSFWYKNPNFENLGKDELPFFCSEDYLKNFSVVMELSYNLDSPLLLNAENLGKKSVSGEKMLLYQAIEQFKIWTGKDAPLEVMKNAISFS